MRSSSLLDFALTVALILLVSFVVSSCVVSLERRTCSHDSDCAVGEYCDGIGLCTRVIDDTDSGDLAIDLSSSDTGLTDAGSDTVDRGRDLRQRDEPDLRVDEPDVPEGDPRTEPDSGEGDTGEPDSGADAGDVRTEPPSDLADRSEDQDLGTTDTGADVADLGADTAGDATDSDGDVGCDLGELTLSMPIRVGFHDSLEVCGGHMVWTGSQYAILWGIYSEGDGGSSHVYLTRLNALGDLMGTTHVVTSTKAGCPVNALGWTGSEFGVFWDDDPDSYLGYRFTRAGSDGVPIGSVVDIQAETTGGGRHMQVVWGDDRYGIVVTDNAGGSANVRFAAIGSDGSTLRTLTPVSPTNRRYYPVIVWAGTEFASVWDYWVEEDVMFDTIQPDGSHGTDVNVTSSSSGSSSGRLAWTGTEHGLVWKDTKDGNSEVYFARLNADGAMLTSQIRLTNSDADASGRPWIAWTGSDFPVVWADNVGDGTTKDLFATLVDVNGDRLTSDLTIAVDSTGTAERIVWADGEVGVTWRDDSEGSEGVYFARIGYCGWDDDGD